jgi:hypothetical protein
LNGDWGLGIGPNPQSPIPNKFYNINIYLNNKYNIICPLIILIKNKLNK